MPDEAFQVGAVDGRVGEAAGVRVVAVGVIAAAAHLDQGAAAALGAEAVAAAAAGGHAGVRQGVVEGVVEDVEAGGGGALVGGFERVDLFDGAVGVDDQGDDRGEPDRFAGAGATQEEAEDLGEDPYPGAGAAVPPQVEDRAQPVAVRGAAGRSEGGGPGAPPSGSGEGWSSWRAGGGSRPSGGPGRAASRGRRRGRR